MTKKSAAALKPKKTEKVDPRENFEEYKRIEKEILRSKQILCNRVDTGKDIREMYYEFFHEFPNIEKTRDYAATLEFVYSEMERRVDGLEFDSFAKAEIGDPFEDLYPKLNDMEFDVDLFEGLLKFNAVRPFAERILKLHRLVLDEVAASGTEVLEDGEPGD